jgi:transposase
MARTSRAEWAKRVERWKDSGLTAKEFGAETGVNPSTLSFWSWKLGSEQREGRRTSTAPSPHSRKRGAEPKRDKPAARLVEVSTVVTSSPPMLEVVLGRGARVRVPAGFDEATLTRVVRAVEAAQ